MPRTVISGQDHGQRPEQAICKVPNLFARLFYLIGTEDRNERSRERAFCHETAKQVRDAKCQEEGIRKNGRAKKEGNPLVPYITEKTAGQSRQRYDGCGLEYLSFFGQSWRAPAL